MDFSRLRHRIIFLKPIDKKLNSMKETVPVWIPYKPGVNNNIKLNNTDEIYITDDYKGNAVIKYINGDPYAHQLDLKSYEVWANVSPTTGREYDESQKLRAETTYTVTTRYFDNITSNMKIMYNGRIFNIVSVLNIGERNTELRIVASERDNYGKDS
ncbi:MAG: phage head closure protein [Clostridia bacterium]|nr:phage head closure protein [Clostridia bacterium]